MVHMKRVVYFVLCLLLLASCSTGGNKVLTTVEPDENAAYKFDAWRPESSAEFSAITLLLQQADELIQQQSYDAATDKLERVIRIKPDYAAAWSRLSWISLQVNAPKRAVQMARRSNSFAFSTPQLQSLNWIFIRNASIELHDEATYEQANQKINSLKAF